HVASLEGRHDRATLATVRWVARGGAGARDRADPRRRGGRRSPRGLLQQRRRQLDLGGQAPSVGGGADDHRAGEGGNWAVDDGRVISQAAPCGAHDGEEQVVEVVEVVEWIERVEGVEGVEV